MGDTIALHDFFSDLQPHCNIILKNSFILESRTLSFFSNICEASLLVSDIWPGVGGLLSRYRPVHLKLSFLSSVPKDSPIDYEIITWYIKETKYYLFLHETNIFSNLLDQYLSEFRFLVMVILKKILVFR